MISPPARLLWLREGAPSSDVLHTYVGPTSTGRLPTRSDGAHKQKQRSSSRAVLSSRSCMRGACSPFFLPVVLLLLSRAQFSTNFSWWFYDSKCLPKSLTDHTSVSFGFISVSFLQPVAQKHSPMFRGSEPCQGEVLREAAKEEQDMCPPSDPFPPSGCLTGAPAKKTGGQQTLG